MSVALHSKAPYFVNKTRPLILGHRGSTGLFPEHTFGSYSSAFNEGVDFVELDIQITKDGHLICNHDPTLKESTNIEEHADKFEDRRGNFTFGFPYENTYNGDFLIHDFTLAELKTLKRTQRYQRRNQALNELFTIMTLNETIELMFDLNKNHPKKDRQFPIGLYIETKMYEFYLKNYGINSAQKVFDVLKAYGLETVEKSQNKIPIILECFEYESLVHFRKITDLPLIHLMKDYGKAYLYETLIRASTYAHGIGPASAVIF